MRLRMDHLIADMAVVVFLFLDGTLLAFEVVFEDDRPVFGMRPLV